MRYLFWSILWITPWLAHTQSQPKVQLCGQVQDGSSEEPLPGASIRWMGTAMGALSDGNGSFCLPTPPAWPATLICQLSTYRTDSIVLAGPPAGPLTFALRTLVGAETSPITVTALANPISLAQSPVLITQIAAAQLEANISPTLTDALLATNGLTERMACGVCGANEVQINGLGGPATLVLIDGMPLMGSLASVYGLMGLPPALIEKVEVIKGPASTLYGTESIGGVINVITRRAHQHPHLTLESWGTTHGETQADLALSGPVGRHKTLLGLHGYHMNTRRDDNADGFMDVVLARRLSLFNKWDFARKSGLPFSLAARYYTEDRTGGTLQWQREWLGSDSVYGEFIATRRAEVLTQYALHRHWRLDASAATHQQDSWYGDVPYAARQHNAFGQLVHLRQLGKHALSAGAAFRYQYYDDSTPATLVADSRPVPGLFAEDLWRVRPRLSLQGGLRLEHHRDHGLVPAPRANLKWDLSEVSSLRLNAGSGFRVVNLFTEDHAALSGSRQVVVEGRLQPERSWNGTLSFSTHTQVGKRVLSWNAEAFHTYYTNRIVPDYSDPNLIRYSSLAVASVTQGLAASGSLRWGRGWQGQLGATWLHTWQEEAGVRTQMLFAPTYTVGWTLGYTHPRVRTQLDCTGKLFGPMALPEYEPPYARATTSETFAQVHLQLRQPLGKRLQLLAGVKNLLDWTQPNALVAPEAPFGDAFDTAYVYGPLQGRRFFAGLRLALGA